MDIAIIYDDQQISVAKEVADFLEQDNRSLQSQERSDRRHLIKSDFEEVLSTPKTFNRFALENLALKNISLQNCTPSLSQAQRIKKLS